MTAADGWLNGCVSAVERVAGLQVYLLYIDGEEHGFVCAKNAFHAANLLKKHHPDLTFDGVRQLAGRLPRLETHSKEER